MTRNELLTLWKFEESFPFIGWDFGHLDGRWSGEPLPWDYGAEVRARLRPEHELLDIDTCGGAFLLSLRHPYERTAVTEALPENAALCRNELAPLGIRVEECAALHEPLPFADASFDRVIAREGAFSAPEVWRVLKPGGVFITEQVGGRNNVMLARRLLRGYRAPFPDWHLGAAAAAVDDAGFEILDADEYFPKLRFYDVGALVYFAHANEWEFPGFSVERCEEELFMLERERGERGYVESMEHRFLLIARKRAQ